MNKQEFIIKLKTLKEAKNERGHLYTNLKVADDDNLYYETKNTTESISINLLFEIYEKERVLDEENLKNYVAEKYYAPVKAIFRDSGICGSNNIVYSSLVSDSLKRKKLAINILLSIPVLGIICYIVWYSFNTNQTDTGIGVIAFLLATNFVFFRHLIWVKKDDFQERTYNAYFTLMLFNISIFPLFNFIEDYHERNKIEVTYTAGFRAWGSTVEFSHITVSYYDKFGNPFTLDSATINDSSNWKQDVWFQDSKSLKMNYSTNFKKDSTGIIIVLKNCGAVLDPKFFRTDKATSFYIKAQAKLIDIDSFYLAKPDSVKYYNAQFCLKVPYEVENGTIADIYYGYELSYMNFPTSKLRIPGLNYDYTFAELENRNNNSNSVSVIKNINNEILGNNGDSIKPIDINLPLTMSAVLFNNDAAFYIYNTKDAYSLPLFKFNIERYEE